MKKSTLSLKPVTKAQPSIASYFAKPASSRLQLKKTSKEEVIITTPKEIDVITKISQTINVVDLTGDNSPKNMGQFSNSKRKLSPSPENSYFKGEVRSQTNNGINDKGKHKLSTSANKKAANLLLNGKYHKSDEQCVPSELVSPLKKTKFSNKEQKSQFSNKEQKSQVSNTEQKSTMLPPCSKSEIDYYLGEDFDASLLEETVIIEDVVSVAANNKVELKGKDELDFAKEFGGSKNPQEDEINDFFKDDWEGDLELEKSFVQEDELDLTQWQRCEVLSVSMDPTNRMKILILKSPNSENKATCTLEGFWMETKVSPGDTISLLAMRAGAGFRITSSEGLLVTQPDQLVSGTAVVGSLFCSRKAVLGDRFKGVDGGNRAMVIGSLVHELFQVSLSKNLCTLEEIKRECRAMLKTQQCVYMLYDAKMSDGEAIDEMMKFTPQIARFIEKYVVKIGNQTPKNVGYQNKRPPPEKTEWDGSIDGLIDIEENIWSPHIGVKGKIDVTIEVTIHDKLNRKLKRLMPLELKTGKASVSAEHRGQVILYTMMMENLGSAILPHSAGLLLYLRESISMHEISAGHSEKRDLIMLRNDLARYLASWSQKSKKISQKEPNNHKNTDKSTEAIIIDKLLDHEQKAGENIGESVGEDDEFLSMDLEKCFMDEDMVEPESKVLPVMELPEPINHHSACGNCPYLTLCSIHLSASDHNLSESHPLQRLQPRALGHLTSAHQKYLLHWTALLALEERDRLELSPLKDIWTVALEEREKRGKCLINMAVDGVVTPVGDRFEHSLRRNSKGNTFEDLQQSLLQMGEYVILSTKGKVAIALGTITHIDSHSVSVILDRDLLKRNARDTLYCLDLYESQSLVIYNLTNLGLLMDDTEISTRLRSIVIDKQPATFDEKISRRVLEMGKEVLQRLNPVQQRAVLKALATKDYILIRGMPGTGKTQTLVALVEVLVRLGKSVLITSQTHSAVDNVLVRLLSSGVSMLRLGSSSRVQPQLLPYCEVTLTKNCHTPDDLHQIYSKASVVGVTCLGSGHSLFTQRKFDVCIVDESTQVLQCSVLRPLYAAHKFVLVGDPDQLPPIVRSNQAKSHGLDESLFKRLDNAKSTFSLCLQYRMNRPIMELANELSYEGKLQAANSNVEQATIKINKGVPNYTEPIESWLKFCVSPALGDSVIFLDTGNTLDLCAKYAQNLTPANGEDKQILRQKDKCANIYEAALVKSIVNSLLAVGILPADMGVIAPYRDQVALLKKVCSEDQHLKESSGGDQHPLEVNTVDQFQGRDKSVIIYSCTKSRSREQNDMQRSRENEILEDHRRLTVAITRSKHKLIMVGDVTTLNQYTPLRKLIDSLKTPLETLNKQPLGHILSVAKLQKDGQFDWEKIIQVLR